MVTIPEDEVAAVALAPLWGGCDALAAGEVGSGDGIGGGEQGLQIPSTDDRPPMDSRLGANINDVISGADRAGGTSASFLLAWDSPEPVSPPLVEAVMIGAAATNGISFTSTPQVLEEQR